jgi:hypothetical protein
MKINVICTVEANIINGPFDQVQNMSIVIGDEANKYFYFANFTCKYESCCRKTRTRVSAVGEGQYKEYIPIKKEI